MTARLDIKFVTPEELAKETGWSARHVRKLARELGACRILGNRMTLTPDDVQAILEARRPCPSPSIDAAKSGITAGRLPVGSYEALRAQRARKLPSESQPTKKSGNGTVVLMDRPRS